MSRTHEIAWAAGFFDGEGYISVQERSSNQYVGYYLRIGVNHVAPEPLEELHRLFGGTIKTDKSLPKGNRKQRSRWCASTKKAAEILKQMLPYMKNKQKVAALALDFQETIGSHGLKVSEEINNKRAWFKNELQRLNSLD